MSNISIFTYCSGYPYRVFKRFAGPLFESGFSGDVYFFIRQCDEITVRRLISKNPDWNIKYVVTNPMFHCQAFRYTSYLKFLDASNEINDNILLCDSRDVLFQKNIDDYDLCDSELYLFEEPDRKIGDCSINSKWIKIVDQFTEEENVFNELKDKNVICSGTTFGTKSAIKKYLLLMSFFLADRVDGKSISRTVKGIDQGVHNYLFYKEKLSDLKVRVLTNEDNLVNTMGDKYHFINSDHKIVNKSHKVSYIAHQYDRLPIEIRGKLSDRYDFIY